MRLWHRFSAKDGSGESSRKGIARTDSIRHLHLRRLLEGYHAWRKDIASVRTASQDKHLQVVLRQQNPALVLKVYAGIAEDAADGHQLFIVNLEDVAAAHGLAQNLFRIKTLTEIDVEYLQMALHIWHHVEKTVDGGMAHRTALR